MKATDEREVKLSPGDGFQLPELGGEALAPRDFSSTYHDTRDLRLARHGVTLRRRVERGEGLWQLKLPKGSSRIELELPGPPAKAPPEMLLLLPAYLRGGSVVPVARLRTRRAVVHVDGAEIVDDAVSVYEGRRVRRRFRELEVELIGGDERTLRRIEKALRRAGAETPPFQPKLFRALDLHWPEQPAALSADAGPREELAAAFAEQYRYVLAHDPGARLGTDSEELHQLRVATRRLRAFLRAAGPLLDLEWAESLRAELGWLGSALGPSRDLDVLLEYLTAEAEELGAERQATEPLLADVAAQRTAAAAAVGEALSSDRYFALLDRLEAAASPRFAGEDVPLADIWWAEVKKLRKAFAPLGPDSPDDDLHSARIRVKRSRYAAELAAPELGKPGAAFVEAAKTMQDILGDHQDSVVAEDCVRAWSVSAPRGRLAAGRLVERQHARRVAARAAWPKAWAKLEAAAKRARR